MNIEQGDKLLALLARIASALETQHTQDDDMMTTRPLADFANFDWQGISATVLSHDEHGTASVSGADGRVYRRRSNQKYGNDIWFSTGDGKKETGEPKYKTLIKFVETNESDVQPLSRAVGAAVKAAPKRTPSPGTPVKTVETRPVITPLVRYIPNESERAAGSALADYCELVRCSDATELKLNSDAIRSKYSSAVNFATLRGLATGDKPASMAEARTALLRLVSVCVEYDLKLAVTASYVREGASLMENGVG